MLTAVADGVLVRPSAFLQTNTTVVVGDDGVLVIDPGITRDELAALARELPGPVVAGFSTHPHWDHLLWHPDLGTPPRHGGARCVEVIGQRLPDAAARARVEGMLPPEISGQVPLDLLGEVTALPAGATTIPWDGPAIRIIEHQAHAAGHCSLVVPERRVLVAADMLSDVLIPFLDLAAEDPIADHLAALDLLEEVAGDADVVIPGHGNVGGPGAAQARIDLDRAYLHALRDGGGAEDPRLQPPAIHHEWLPDVHERQLAHVS